MKATNYNQHLFLTKYSNDDFFNKLQSSSQTKQTKFKHSSLFQTTTWLFLTTFLLLLTSSCSFIPVEIGEIEKVKFLGFKDRKMAIELTIPVINPNNHSFTLTNAQLDVLYDNEKLGEVNYLSKIKIPKNSTQKVTLQFDLEFPDLLSGGLTLLRIYSSKEIQLAILGKIKVKSGLFIKNIEVNEKFTFKINQK